MYQILREIRRTASMFSYKLGHNSRLSRDSVRTAHGQYLSTLLITSTYLLSWMPYACVCFMFYFHQYVPVKFEMFAIFTSKSATVTSPIIFCLIEKPFRKFLKKDGGSSHELNAIDRHSMMSNTSLFSRSNPSSIMSTATTSEWLTV